MRLLACALLAGCSSCIWYPIHGQEPGELAAISAAAKSELAPGRATREDVLCRLGVPQWSSPDGARFVYATRQVEGTVYIILVVDADMKQWGEDRFDLCEFDDRGVVLRWREARRDFSGSGSFVGKLLDSEVAGLFPQ